MDDDLLAALTPFGISPAAAGPDDLARIRYLVQKLLRDLASDPAALSGITTDMLRLIVRASGQIDIEGWTREDHLAFIQARLLAGPSGLH